MTEPFSEKSERCKETNQPAFPEVVITNSTLGIFNVAGYLSFVTVFTTHFIESTELLQKHGCTYICMREFRLRTFVTSILHKECRERKNNNSKNNHSDEFNFISLLHGFDLCYTNHGLHYGDPNVHHV